MPVYVWSLGCGKNRADTERLLGSLGLPARLVSSPTQARLVFINTCAFIEPAIRESLRAIFDTLRRLRRLHHKPLVAVAGCLPGRFGNEELRKEIPEVDVWLNSHHLESWPRALNEALGLAQPAHGKRLITNPSWLWLKIAEGCQHNCAFCTIPSIRGGLRSEKAELILDEARAAIASGISEIDLVAQDVTAWGNDLQADAPVRDLPALARELAQLPGLAWLRLLYLYPASITPDLLAALGEGLPLLPYLDIPFQHSEPGILKAMGRPFSTDPRRLLEKIHNKLPGGAVRTTLMVGYPGESEQDFRNLCAFVRDARFYHVGVFVFQPEEGTRAANLPNRVPEELARERKQELMQIQAGISREILSRYVERKMRVLVDESCDSEWPGLCKGRVWFQAPEVDGVTYVSGPGVRPGKMVDATIEDAQIYDLSALAEPE